jgi:hypothetical protein
LNLSDATNRGSNLGAAELAKVLSDLEVVKNPVRVYVPLCKFNQNSKNFSAFAA